MILGVGGVSGALVTQMISFFKVFGFTLVNTCREMEGLVAGELPADLTPLRRIGLAGRLGDGEGIPFLER